MNLDLITAIIFFILVLLFYYKTRDKWIVQGKIILLYKTKIGLNFMDKIAKTVPNLIRYIAYSGVFFGFIGMLLIAYKLIIASYRLLFVEGAVSEIAPVLPWVQIPGLPTLGFWHWIIAIFVVVLIHEFSHGILARVYNMKLKSSGFGFIGPLPIAFVEPDEKQVSKASKKAQLSMFAAGPYSNLIFGILFYLLFLFAILPMGNNIFVVDKLNVNNFTAGLPAESSGLQVPFEIYSINDKQLSGLNEKGLEGLFLSIKPGDTVSLKTDQGDFEIKTVADKSNSRGLIGIQTEIISKIRDGINPFYGSIYMWFKLLILWLFLINLGIGLFNLLPLGPVDGGRMFLTALLAITKNEEKAKKIWSSVAFFFLFLIIINLMPWFIKLFNFLINLFV